MHHSELRLGSLFIDINGNKLDAKFITSTGTVNDYFSIDKGPLITVTTPKPTATEYGPTPGQFSISRTGSTAAALSLQATIGGTAPGSRYTPITVPITIPAGAAVHSVNVIPQLDTLLQGAETVTLTGEPNIEYRLSPQFSGIVTINDAPAGSPIALWHLIKFGLNANNQTIRGDNADPDFDGADNLMEYALGLEPMIPSSQGLPNLIPSSNYLTLDVQRNPTATDINYIVEVGNDLADWSALDTTILQDTPTRLQVRDNVPSSSAQRRFIRLRLERPAQP